MWQFGLPLTGQGARPRSAQLIRDDLAAVGLPIEIEGQPIDFKATRSSFSSWLDGADVPRERIKRLLGHAAHDVTEAHYTKRDMEQLMAAVLVIRLVWTPGLGTRPVAMTGGTSSEGNLTESLEPLSRLELETYGLRNRCSTTELKRRFSCEKGGSIATPFRECQPIFWNPTRMARIFRFSRQIHPRPAGRRPPGRRGARVGPPAATPTRLGAPDPISPCRPAGPQRSPA